MRWLIRWNYGDSSKIDEDKNYAFRRAESGVANDFFTNPEVITPSTDYISTKGHTIIQLHDDLCDGACCRFV